jgi:hypothetical protein
VNERKVRTAYAPRILTLKLSWRFFSKQHPILADTLEWSGCGILAAIMFAATLIANS